MSTLPNMQVSMIMKLKKTRPLMFVFVICKFFIDFRCSFIPKLCLTPGRMSAKDKFGEDFTDGTLALAKSLSSVVTSGLIF